MAAVHASPKQVIWKFPQQTPTCAVLGDSQTRHLHTHFDPSSPDSPAFISQPGAQIDDIAGLLDFVPRGTSFLILHIGTNDLARTSADIAIEKYAKLLDYIRSERPDIGSIFATLVLPRGLNERLRRPNWRQVHHINKQAHRFNCRLVNLCKSRRNVFFIDHAIHHFPPRMVLAADGLHPNFAGVSLLCWNIYNVLLNTRKEHMGVWSDHVPTFEANQPPPENPSFAQVLKSNASASNVQQRTPSSSTLAKVCQAHPPRTPQAMGRAAHSKKKQARKPDPVRAETAATSSSNPTATVPTTQNAEAAAPTTGERKPSQRPRGPRHSRSRSSPPSTRPRPTRPEPCTSTPAGPPPTTEDREPSDPHQAHGEQAAAPSSKRYDLRKYCGSTRS
ncbi:hypothetical protein HPB52_004563 [Rhipicephalus sanguineus]|uniref:SGNH hydrolase-type esterase domain-containing protein n=1 Tax=Rhipicephalus sanguineus TaxID=34632 RepID=A0A9D4PBE2_RHISA|nr:hypothetical protein HPB52_004563 [Rhipicephalus sanguineus]